MNTPVRYLVAGTNHTPFYTNYYDMENFYTEGDIIFDLHTNKYCDDGEFWHDIEEDHL
jgi:hypothetical protein